MLLVDWNSLRLRCDAEENLFTYPYTTKARGQSDLSVANDQFQFIIKQSTLSMGGLQVNCELPDESQDNVALKAKKFKVADKNTKGTCDAEN